VRYKINISIFVSSGVIKAKKPRRYLRCTEFVARPFPNRRGQCAGARRLEYAGGNRGGYTRPGGTGATSSRSATGAAGWQVAHAGGKSLREVTASGPAARRGLDGCWVVALVGRFCRVMGGDPGIAKQPLRSQTRLPTGAGPCPPFIYTVKRSQQQVAMRASSGWEFAGKDKLRS